LIALFLIAVFSLGAIVLAAPDQDDDAGVATAGTRFEGAFRPDGPRAPDFALTNQHGDTISMRHFRGQPVIVTFL
jgi:cytochrome oxidase Cu insertion factor (SCO1/SenC/PrrC family)